MIKKNIGLERTLFSLDAQLYKKAGDSRFKDEIPRKAPERRRFLLVGHFEAFVAQQKVVDELRI